MATNSMDKSHIAVHNITTPTGPTPRNFSFSIHSDADAFNLYGYAAAQKDELISFKLHSPSASSLPKQEDNDLYRGKVIPGGYVKEKGKNAFTVPIKASQADLLGGDWTGEIKYQKDRGIPEIKVAERITSDAKVIRLSLPVKLVMVTNTGVAKKKKWAEKELKKVVRIYQQAGINLELSDITVVPLPSHPISSEFWNANTKDLVLQHSSANHLTVLMVEDLQTPNDAERGRTGDIPGPQGFVNRFAAVLIQLSSSPNKPVAVIPGFLAVVIAHEMGHYLGLTHETGNGDPNNLMYPHANHKSDAYLNAKQRFIIRQQPLVVQHDTTAYKTPITSIKVTIQTGNQNPATGDGPGTSMNIRLSLGSESGGYRTWLLSSLGAKFNANSTDRLSLKGFRGMYVEDLTSYVVSCSWSAPMWIPFIGGPDRWHFKSIKIEINGKTLFDDKVNRFLTYKSGRNSHENNL